MGALASAVLKVRGMGCEHCRAAVKRELEKVPGVSRVEVNLEAGTATVDFDPGLAGAGDFRRAIEEAGYELED